MATIRKPGEAVKVSLPAYTMEPVKAIALAQLNMTGDMRFALTDLSHYNAQEIFKDICKTELQGAFEFAHFNFQISGVSRAFQQQLTRTRLAAYSAESLRFTEAGMEVLAGPHMNEEQLAWYKNGIDSIDKVYHDLLDMGVPIEDARGILPLNVLSKIGMSVSYKTLIHMSRVRMCYQSQKGEWGPVFQAMYTLLHDIDPLLCQPLGAFCDHGQACPFGSKLDRKCERG